MKKTIAQILKYCREGQPLWSSAYGNVCLEECTGSNIIVRTTHGKFMINAEGMLCSDGECILFPSQEQRDWDMFWPYKDGDVVALRGEDIEISQLFIFKETVKIGSAYCYVFLDADDTLDISEGRRFINSFATKSEEDRLFKALKKNGYRWDPIKKEVVPVEKKLENIEIIAAEEKKEKFDINMLKPFDRVLVRDNDGQRWTGDLFLYKTVSSSYEGVHCLWNQCIPYEGNETLLGTTKQPDEYYITWEEEK
jgi:hypothetical protein